MSDNVHPVVRLLAKRMESHPEEFRIYDNSTLAIGGRWETWISQIRPFMNEAEHRLLFNKSKEVFLQRVHEEVMDELLNGDERRAKAQQEYELERHKIAAMQQQTQLYSQQSSYPYYNSIMDTYEFGNGMIMTKAQAEDNPGLFSTIKKGLGLK